MLTKIIKRIKHFLFRIHDYQPDDIGPQHDIDKITFQYTCTICGKTKTHVAKYDSNGDGKIES